MTALAVKRVLITKEETRVGSNAYPFFVPKQNQKLEKEQKTVIYLQNM